MDLRKAGLVAGILVSVALGQVRNWELGDR